MLDRNRILEKILQLEKEKEIVVQQDPLKKEVLAELEKRINDLKFLIS